MLVVLPPRKAFQRTPARLRSTFSQAPSGEKLNLNHTPKGYCTLRLRATAPEAEAGAPAGFVSAQPPQSEPPGSRSRSIRASAGPRPPSDQCAGAEPRPDAPATPLLGNPVSAAPHFQS